MDPTRFPAYRITQLDRGVEARFEDCALSDLDPGEVVVRVEYSDVNYKDALAATGKGRILQRASCIGGIDLAGTVVSSTDERFAAGDAVLATGYELGVKHHGGYAGYARLPAAWVVALPQGLGVWEAMALGTAGFTAGLAIARMEANGLTPAGGPVIVSGATGGVGSIAVDALARLGYEVVALTGKAGEADYLRRLGAAEVRQRAALDFSKVKPLERATWAGALDNLGGEVLAWMASTMKQRGVIASIGLAASADLHTTVLPFILRGVSLLGVDSVACPMPQRQAVWRRLAADMRPAHLGEICRTIAFSELPGVFDAFIEGRVRGRIVVRLQA